MEFMQYCVQILPQLMNGLMTTLRLFALTLVLSLPLGLIVALGRISKFYPLKWVTDIYVWVLRGTPLMLQLFFVYYALPLIIPSLRLEAFEAALLAMTLNYAAYFAEIFRAGIQSIDVGQHEAAKALGFGYGQTMTLIIIPQMIKRTLPPVTNETITLVKDTALVAAITMSDLLQSTKTIVSREVNPTAYILAALIYLAITLILTVIFKKIEKHYNVSDAN